MRCRAGFVTKKRGSAPGRGGALPAAAVFILMATGGVRPGALQAQTTDTERAAARPILEEIEALQARLAPGERAARLAEAPDADRDRLLADVEAQWTGELQAVSDWIGRHPEVGFEEFRAADTLTALLETRGFQVRRPVADLATAFVGTWTSPAGADGPTLGLILEYDALRDTGGPFHGDQHNAQGPVALAAAFALQDFMEREGVPGRIQAFGTPAEEMGPPSKLAMLEAGVFEGADILVRSHGGRGTRRNRAGFGTCCLNIDMRKFVFHGRPSHQRSSWFGRNALEAAVHFYSMVDGLRSSWRPEASIQGVIPEGGVAPNVVPERAVVDYYIRYPDEVYLAHITEMMEDAARSVSDATRTRVEIENYGTYRDGITLGTLEELWFAYAKRLGAPELNPEPDRPAGYEETGFVSRALPGVGVSVHSTTASNHTHEALADALSEVGHRAFLLDAQIMAAVLYHFLTDADFRAAVKEEHATMQGLFDSYIQRLKEAYEPELALDRRGR